jgi:hypothetical protein
MDDGSMRGFPSRVSSKQEYRSGVLEMPLGWPAWYVAKLSFNETVIVIVRLIPHKSRGSAKGKDSS